MAQTSVHVENKLNNGMKSLGGNGMFKQMKKRVKNQKGLTLIELLAVIVILAIIAAIAVPAIGNIIENSRAKALVSDAVNTLNAANLYFIENPNGKPTEGSTSAEVTVELNDLVTAGFLESKGKLESATVTKNTGDGGNKITAKGKNGSVVLEITDAMTLDQLNVDGISVKDNKVEFPEASSEDGETN